MQGNLQDVGQGLANVGSTLSNITPTGMKKSDAPPPVGEVTPPSTSGCYSCLVSGWMMLGLILSPVNNLFRVLVYLYIEGLIYHIYTNIGVH